MQDNPTHYATTPVLKIYYAFFEKTEQSIISKYNVNYLVLLLNIESLKLCTTNELPAHTN